MVSSLKAWFPSVPFSNKNLMEGTNQGTKFFWTPYMQMEFEQLKKIFQDQIRLSPFDPEKEIKFLTAGASSKGIGFVFYQNANEKKPGEDVMIVQANSSGLKNRQLSYSPMDCETILVQPIT